MQGTRKIKTVLSDLFGDSAPLSRGDLPRLPGRQRWGAWLMGEVNTARPCCLEHLNPKINGILGLQILAMSLPAAKDVQSICFRTVTPRALNMSISIDMSISYSMKRKEALVFQSES